MKTTNEVFKEVLEELGFANHKPSEMSNSDYWLCTETAMLRFAEQFNNQLDNWIKIENEADLPKESWNYWIMQSDNIISTLKDYWENKKYWYITATHYQPIQKPKPPIY